MVQITIKDLTPEKLAEIIAGLKGEVTTVTMSDPSPTKETHVGIALDASGSMGSIKDEIIGAFNASLDQLVADQDKLGLVYVTYVTFGERGGSVIEKFSHQPLAALKRLTTETYQPSGLTPFYDGLGLLLNLLKRYDRTDDVDRAFLINVFTDGGENASREWKRPGMLRDEVSRLQAKGNWTITYAGANVNLDAVAQNVGLLRANMMGFEASRIGTQSMGGQHVNSMSSYSMSRSAGASASVGFYGDTTDDAARQEALRIGQQQAQVVHGSRNVSIGGSCQNSSINTGTAPAPTEDVKAVLDVLMEASRAMDPSDAGEDDA